MTTLSPHDTYILARALVGLSWDGVPLSPAVGLLLAHLDPNVPDDMRFLRKVLGQELLRAVLAVDPNAPAPELPHRAADLNILPELPESARLTMDQVNEAARVGHWLDDYLRWAGNAANETPLNFHLGAGLYLAAIAVGRRMYIQTPWRQQVFPNLYLMVVAVSTYYRKSAGLSLAAEVARLAIPHMMMPQPGSPENFMSMLGGVLPPNFSDIPQQDRARLEKGNRYAAQRGLLRDELSGLFKSMGRDYMAGLKELIMTLYDCPPYLDSNTNNKGLVVIRDAALSILGAATPTELATALSSADWFNGNLARFALLTPEPDYVERPAPKESQTPTDLANRLKRLHERLPEPPLPDALWAVKVRRAYGTPKYQQIKGGNVNGLYGADGLADREVALFCEGEFDALIAAQEAGDLVAPVTLSSASVTLSARWYAELTHCHTILVAYDHDAAGEKGANRLLSLSLRFRAIELPAGKDITEFYLKGGDLYGWIEGVLQTRPIESPEVTL